MKLADHLLVNYQSELWKKCYEGDKFAFAEIAEHYYSSLYHYGTRFTADRDLIKDCIQDLFLEIWEKRESLIHILDIKPYLFQSLRNNLIRKVRRQSVFSDITEKEDETVGDSSPELHWILAETDNLTKERLRQTIELLPKRQREALYLKYYENLSYEEIAKIMGLHRQAVANYLQYGIQKLREYWQSQTILFATILNLLSL